MIRFRSVTTRATVAAKISVAGVLAVGGLGQGLLGGGELVGELGAVGAFCAPRQE